MLIIEAEKSLFLGDLFYVSLLESLVSSLGKYYNCLRRENNTMIRWIQMADTMLHSAVKRRPSEYHSVRLASLLFDHFG